MPFPTPDLDDRGFEQLVRDAIDAARRACPEWTDRSPSDPLIALLEASAFLTDLLIYRVNRMPEKAYVAFLELIGARIAPPAAASVTVRLTRRDGVNGTLELPAGARVSASGAGVSFVLRQAARLEADRPFVEVEALHCAVVQGELLGTSSGQPGQTFALRNAPVIAATGDGLDLIVGVEEAPGDGLEDLASREFEGRSFRIWREVEAFTSPERGRPAYVCDRHEGRVTFAPAVNARSGPADGSDRGALARAPAPGREIRAWYRCGGGAAGNLAAHTLDRLDDPNPGVDVDNPAPATGGRDAETLQEALTRGPHALRSTTTAVTARDFERAALAVRGAARARAVAVAQRWRHGVPGTVEIQLVPYVDADLPAATRAAATTVLESCRPELLARTGRIVARKAPLGVRTTVVWARLRTLSVTLRAVCYREESPVAVRERLERQIYATISPFAARAFGESLRASDLFELVAREPGIRYVDSLGFRIDEAPRVNCRTIRPDAFQPGTWHVASDGGIYRTLDDGRSWCATMTFPTGETALLCRPHPTRPGWLAAISRSADGTHALHLSETCGESWQQHVAAIEHDVRDAAWSTSPGEPELYLATSKGLFVCAAGAGYTPERIVVLEDDEQYGFRAVAVAPLQHGVMTIAVAAGQRKGVWLSTTEPRSGSFRFSGLAEVDIRVLATEDRGGRLFLWAGLAAVAQETGSGCARTELRGPELDPAGWRPFATDWQGGSCEAIAFGVDEVFAGSNRAGVLRLAASGADPRWTAGRLDNGLPQRDRHRLLHEVDDLAARTDGPGETLLLAAGPVGVYASDDGAKTFRDAAPVAFDDRVDLPEGWLFASGRHTIEIESEEVALGRDR